MSKIKSFKGLRSNLPSTGLVVDAYYQCIDTGELFLAASATELITVGLGGSTDLPLSVVDGKLCITYNQ